MCLACEMDALWYAEWDRLAAEGAARSAGAALSVESPAAVETTEEGTRDLPPAQAGGETATAGGTSAAGGSAVPATRFRCEEAE